MRGKIFRKTSGRGENLRDWCVHQYLNLSGNEILQRGRGAFVRYVIKFDAGVVSISNSVVRWAAAPMPLEPNASAPGLTLASATSSLASFAARLLVAVTIKGAVTSSDTAEKLFKAPPRGSAAPDKLVAREH